MSHGRRWAYFSSLIRCRQNIEKGAAKHLVLWTGWLNSWFLNLYILDIDKSRSALFGSCHPGSGHDCFNRPDLSIVRTLITSRKSNIHLITFHSVFSRPLRRRPATMYLWRHRLRRPCLVWLCCWGPWGLGCVATAPGSWPSTTGPLHVCCSWLALTLMLA